MKSPTKNKVNPNAKVGQKKIINRSAYFFIGELCYSLSLKFERLAFYFWKKGNRL